MKSFILIAAASAISIISIAQNKKAPIAKPDTKVASKTIITGGYTALKPGIEYRLFLLGKGNVFPKDSSFVKMHIQQKAGDSAVFSSYVVDERNPGLPILNFVTKGAGGPMDYAEVMMKMRVGDSAVIRFNKDSIFHGPAPAWVKPTDELLVHVKLTEIMTDKQKDSLMAEQEKMMQQQMEAQRAKQNPPPPDLSVLGPKEETEILAYAKSKNLKTIKTASGLHYVITKLGTGAMPKVGQQLTMNYTGIFLNDKPFDSNILPEFSHVSPFTFGLGQHQVIQGWDEGIALLPIGTKAVLLIPSYLAYGSAARDPIPANSILRFDVEVIDAK
jgi:FKBP-type peptidyl-prolyl cis-trans isomerase FkpA